MNQIPLKFLVFLAVVLSLTGCRNSVEAEKSLEEEVEALREKVGNLEGKIDRIESRFDDVTGSVLKLRNEIEDFGSENWKVNVPEVEYEFEQLRMAVSELEKEL